jgi:predicted acetyltransferase
MADVTLIRPTLAEVPAYVNALEKGWSPDTVRGVEAAREQLDSIRIDAAGFVDSLHDPDAKAGPIKLPDGSSVARLPSIVRWIWDEDFCGSIGFRWQSGTSALPKHVLGHIGFSVVPWKQGIGRAKQGLALLLPEARKAGLSYVELTADPSNIASHKVIQACGGRPVERFRKSAAYGNREAIRFRIDLL